MKLINGYSQKKRGTTVRWLLLLVTFCLIPVLSLAAALPQPVQTHPSFVRTPASIQQFIQYVWRTNPAIQSAQSEVARAGADFSQSQRPIYNPSLELEAEHVRKEPFEDTYTAGISQTIDLFNKRGARAAVGQHSFIESKANLSAQQLALATQTLKALAEYRTVQAVVQLAKRRTQLLRRFKDQNARKFKSGDIAQDALDQASLAYAEAISQQADAEVVLTRAKQHLIAISQTASKYWPRLPRRLPKPLRPSSVTQQAWLRTLPILQVYSARVATAQASVRVARTEAKPDPTISLRGGTEDKEPLVGGSISIPLFIRNNFQDQVRAANHQAIAVEQMRMNVYRQVKAALQGDLSRYRILYVAMNRWQHASKHSLDGGIELLNRLWSAGELSTTDYLVQLKQRIDSQIAGQELNGKAWQMWCSVMEASGQLNTWLAKT
ncbi:MAG: TolC family protein [Gammaproteobacteria bacterium]